jgi:divalent metal cation (Fe/Co/Zn/Cd) transporter
MLTLFGAALAAVTCTALVLQRVEGWWWADAVGALVIAVLLLSEAVRTLGAATDGAYDSPRGDP